MSFRDILAPILSPADDEAALAAAETVAAAFDAHLTALLVELEPDPVYAPDGMMISLGWSELLEGARKQFAADKARLDQRLATSKLSVAARELEAPLGLAPRQTGIAARYADLVVMRRPGGAPQEDVRTALFEGVLFGAGRPVLLAPPDWRKAPIGRNIVIAWNGKREGARAVADAAPLLERAEKVEIVTVGASDKVRDKSLAQADELAKHLGRRGVKSGVRVIGELGFTEGATLLAEGAAAHADLLIMGGYGRSRLGEFIFGGMTRELLDSANLPVLMSH
jgi:nucleotide-binding universal stress UspA family protein